MLHVSMTVSLDDCLAPDFVGRQISITKAVGVDTNQMTAIHDLPVRLWRMTHDDAFAAHVGARQWVRQVGPVSQNLGLVKHLNFGVVGCMNKDRVIDFVVWKQFMKKDEVIRWNLRQ